MGKKYVPRKSKGAAVALAFFFGLFGWLYTYRADAWKFWLNIIFTVVTGGLWGPAAWLWALIDASLKPREFYEEYYGWSR